MEARGALKAYLDDLEQNPNSFSGKRHRAVMRRIALDSGLSLLGVEKMLYLFGFRYNQERDILERVE